MEKLTIGFFSSSYCNGLADAKQVSLNMLDLLLFCLSPCSSLPTSMNNLMTNPTVIVMDLVTRNLQEVLNAPILEKIFADGRAPRIYWGTAPTGKVHLGYLVPMTKLADFLKAGCSVVVLLADLHAYLDNMKAPLDVLEFRVQYYERTIKAMLRAIGVPIDKLEFVIGKSYQLTPNYTMDIFKMTNVTSQNDAKRAGAEVVKQTANPPLSGLLYPLMQALDEEYLHVDAQFGGVDQRKIFVLAEERLPEIGYAKRAHLMNPMIPGLAQGGKMSASDPNSKIDLVDTPDIVKKKIKKAFAAEGIVEGNGLIAFLEYAALPILDIQTNGKPSIYVNRDEKWGGPVTYTNIDDLKADYAANRLSPADLKIGTTDVINAILKPIQEDLFADSSFEELQEKAYPPPPPPEKKTKKKPRDLGSRFPGNKPQASASSESSAPEPATKSSSEASEAISTQTKDMKLE